MAFDEKQHYIYIIALLICLVNRIQNLVRYLHSSTMWHLKNIKLSVNKLLPSMCTHGFFRLCFERFRTSREIQNLRTLQQGAHRGERLKLCMWPLLMGERHPAGVTSYSKVLVEL